MKSDPCNLRRQQLKDTIDKYKDKLTKEEFWDIIYTGHYIHQQGVGICFPETEKLIKERYKK